MHSVHALSVHALSVHALSVHALSAHAHLQLHQYISAGWWVLSENVTDDSDPGLSFISAPWRELQERMGVADGAGAPTV